MGPRSLASAAIVVSMGLCLVRPAGADVGIDGSLQLTPSLQKLVCTPIKSCEDVVRAECDTSNPNGWQARRFCKQYCTSQDEIDRIKARIGCLPK